MRCCRVFVFPFAAVAVHNELWSRMCRVSFQWRVRVVVVVSRIGWVGCFRVITGVGLEHGILNRRLPKQIPCVNQQMKTARARG